MPEERTPPSITELLKHAAWTRHLARGLVGSDAAADDVVQDAWVAALRRPPDTTRPLRPWLGTVVRNNVFNRSREHARRETRETGGDAREVPDAPDRVLERLELHKVLVEIVSELPEPYRRTVLLAYFEELASAEIGARENVPASTVRGRLKTALGLMREALDLRFGRGAWLPAVAGLLRPSSAAAPGAKAAAAKLGAAKATGAAATSALQAAIVIVVASAAVTTGAVVHTRHATRAEAVSEAEAEPSAPIKDEGRTRAASTEQRETNHAARPQTQIRSSTEPSPTESLPAVIQPTITRGIVIASGGQAALVRARVGQSGGLSGAIVRVVAGAPAQLRSASPRLQIRDGRFPSYAVLAPAGVSIVVENGDDLSYSVTVSRGEATLWQGAVLAKHGAVVSMPVAGDILKITASGSASLQGASRRDSVIVAATENPFAAITDSNGAFDLGDLPPGRYTVEIWDEALGTKVVDLAVPSIQPGLRVVYGAEPPGAAVSSGSRGPCKIARTDPVVVHACEHGGRNEASKLMKDMIRQAKAKGEKFTCDGCHKDFDDFELTSSARADFDKLIAVAAKPRP